MIPEAGGKESMLCNNLDTFVLEPEHLFTDLAANLAPGLKPDASRKTHPDADMYSHAGDSTSASRWEGALRLLPTVMIGPAEGVPDYVFPMHSLVISLVSFNAWESIACLGNIHERRLRQASKQVVPVLFLSRSA